MKTLKSIFVLGSTLGLLSVGCGSEVRDDGQPASVHYAVAPNGQVGPPVGQVTIKDYTAAELAHLDDDLAPGSVKQQAVSSFPAQTPEELRRDAEFAAAVKAPSGASRVLVEDDLPQQVEDLLREIDERNSVNS